MSGRELILKDCVGNEISVKPSLNGFVLRLPCKGGFTSAYMTKDHVRSLLAYLQEQLK